MVIQEFLPNPVGKDQDGEYIVLKNESGSRVDLGGWQIRDASGKSFSLSGYQAAPGEELLLPYSATKIILNNNGETLELIDAFGSVVDSLGYAGAAEEGRNIQRESIAPERLLEEAARAGAAPAGFPAAGWWQSPLLFMVLAAAILALLAVWILRSIPERAEQEQNSLL